LSPRTEAGRQLPALVADLGNVALDDVDARLPNVAALYGGEIRIRPAKGGDYLEAAVPGKDGLIELAVANVPGFQTATRGVAGTRFVHCSERWIPLV
jgi:hypothetical protein